MQEDEGGREMETFVLPSTSLDILPDEVRQAIEAVAEDQRIVLESVQRELDAMAKVSNSLATMVSLKHVQKRLTAFKFEPDMDSILELDMLTTAFVVTYARLHHGGSATGFARDALPVHLRPIHDAILDVRNKRFAHHADHHSVSNNMQIGVENDCYDIQFELRLGYHIGGASEWPELVDFLDGMIAGRLDKLIAKLEAKTGKKWSLPMGPAPE